MLKNLNHQQNGRSIIRQISTNGKKRTKAEGLDGFLKSQTLKGKREENEFARTFFHLLKIVIRVRP